MFHFDRFGCFQAFRSDTFGRNETPDPRIVPIIGAVCRARSDWSASPVGMCGADFGAHLRKQYEEYGRIIREANIKAE